MQVEWVLASDIDNTLTGDPEALKKLGAQLDALRQQKRLFLILSTGRRLDQVLDGFGQEGIPTADAIISQVGTEIYLAPFAVDMAPLPEWDQFLHEEYAREEALRFLQGIEGMEMQPNKFNTSLKVSCYLDKAPDPDRAAALIQQRVIEAGAGDKYQVVWSSSRDLDILPADSGKGKAIRFLIQFEKISPQKVIVAGDSGNDRAMFDEFSHGIVVGNAKPELKRLREENSQPGFYFAQNSFAAGVEEGLRHFGVL